jgi:hypothetical protein
VYASAWAAATTHAVVALLLMQATLVNTLHAYELELRVHAHIESAAAVSTIVLPLA